MSQWSDTDFGHFVAGISDADSSFYIAIKRKPKARYGFDLYPTWQMDKADDNELLKKISDFLGVGRLHQYRLQRGPHKRRRLRLSVNGFDCKVLVLFFSRFPLRGKKKRDFQIWRRAVEIYCGRRRSRWNPWTKDELYQLLDLKEEMADRLKSKPTDSHLELRRLLESA